MDLTKKITVIEAGDPGTFHVRYFQNGRIPTPENEEAYRRLFEAAPKMLALLNALMNFRDNEAYLPQIVAEARTLIAEIEGPQVGKFVEEDWLRSKFLRADSFTPENIPPIKGGFYAKPVKVLHVEVAPDYTSAPKLTVEYEGGEVATGLALFGEDRKQFERARLAYLGPSRDRRRKEGMSKLIINRAQLDMTDEEIVAELRLPVAVLILKDGRKIAFRPDDNAEAIKSIDPEGKFIRTYS